MKNHEIAVKAIKDAKAVVTEIEWGANQEIAGEQALKLMALAANLTGDDKLAVEEVANQLDAIANCPAWVSVNGFISEAFDLMDQFFFQSALEDDEEQVCEDDDFNFDFDDGFQGDNSNEDVEDMYNQAIEVIDDEQLRIEDEIWSYQYGNRRNDKNACGYLRQLKSDLRVNQKNRAFVEKVLSSYNEGDIDAYHAINMMYNKASQL